MSSEEVLVNLSDIATNEALCGGIKSRRGHWWFSLRKAGEMKSRDQLKYLNGCVYVHAGAGIEEAWGERMTKDRTDAFFKKRFLQEPITDRTTGEVKEMVTRSLATLTKEEMTTYIDQIIKFSAEQLNTVIPPADKFWNTRKANGQATAV